MPTTIYGPYLFGEVEAPFELPCPWLWDSSPEDWLMAIGPDGNRHLATNDELHLVTKTKSGWGLVENPPINRRPK
jgi:hypothetical protein